MLTPDCTTARESQILCLTKNANEPELTKKERRLAPGGREARSSLDEALFDMLSHSCKNSPNKMKRVNRGRARRTKTPCRQRCDKHTSSAAAPATRFRFHESKTEQDRKHLFCSSSPRNRRQINPNTTNHYQKVVNDRGARPKPNSPVQFDIPPDDA